jgi:hypothetical protein
VVHALPAMEKSTRRQRMLRLSAIERLLGPVDMSREDRGWAIRFSPANSDPEVFGLVGRSTQSGMERQ